MSKMSSVNSSQLPTRRKSQKSRNNGTGTKVLTSKQSLLSMNSGDSIESQQISLDLPLDKANCFSKQRIED